MTSKARKLVFSLTFLGAIVLALAGAYYFGVSQQSGGLKDKETITGRVEYTVRDSTGGVKAHRVYHNAIKDALLNAARDRLGVDASLTGTSNTDLFDNIQACSAATSGVSCTLSTGLDANPADGTNTAETETGNYKVVKTFTASAASTIAELQLTRGAATSGTAETNIGAFQLVSITLANTDTLQITWTIDID